MDLSKLPRSSRTSEPPPPAPLENGISRPVTDDRTLRPSLSAGPEAWISMAFGIILILMHPTFIKFIFADKPYRPFVDPSIDYAGSINFWSDLAITGFAVVLILEGLVLLFSRNVVLVLAALILTIAATAGNLLYVVLTYNSHGLALISAIAAVFGVYISLHHWRLLQTLRAGA